MKKLLSSILLFVLLFVFSVSDSFASTLIYKTQKEVKTKNDITELAVVDVSKYKQVRIGVILADSEKFDVAKILRIEAVEDTDSIYLDKLSVTDFYRSDSINLENVSNKIRITTKDLGVFKIFIWASL
ncbi:MAG TPA: hypothetical protein PKY59_12440 [Pyrinomonadaceae bacterium]|nr:hypothetical protein [Pyrinomonadaceae bacterium]